MKKFFAYVVATLLIVTATNCSKKEDVVVYDDLKLSLKEIAVRVGNEAPFTIEAGSGEYEISVANKSIATYSSSQKQVTVQGVAQGETTITVTDKKSNQTATVKVTVSKELLDLALNKTDVTLELGDEPAVVNITSGNGKYEVSVADTAIVKAEISEGEITITGLASGTTTVTVKDVETAKEVAINVTVTEKVQIKLSVEAIGLNVVEKKEVSEKEVVTNNLKEVEIVSGSGNYEVASSNENIVKAVLKGNKIELTGIAAGTATITVTNQTDVPATLQVKVYKLGITINGVELTSNEQSVSLVGGQEIQIKLVGGSGNYEIIQSGTPTVNTTLADGVLTIRANQVSTTQQAEVIIKDIETGKELPIGVIVTKEEEVHTDEELVLVEGGSFIMGSDHSFADKDEKPLHKVTLDSFKISRYEITNNQFVKFLNAKGNRNEANMNWYNGKDIVKNNGVYEVIENRGNYPVTYVSWYGAKAYAEWSGGSLPTEAQWEYAAKGGKKSEGFLYSGSNDENEVSFHLYNSKGLNPVGLKKPNELGIYDMSGNAWEWVADKYAEYTATDKVNPEPVTTGSLFVRRGASCYCKPKYGRPANRGTHKTYQNNVGFRVVYKVK
ncbi:MAG: formylglycine-generating enzyme family protein [Capnocytophaga sp.]|nr:formylglycine-generating enzyme family protein [Capnocytophaga sp.]